jgi:hypothetical protein
LGKTLFSGSIAATKHREDFQRGTLLCFALASPVMDDNETKMVPERL